MTSLGVVAGMAVEARCLPRPSAGDALEVACSGGDAARAAAAAERLVSKGARALLSFGVAGGLDPALGPGALIVAETVIAPDGTRQSTDSAWRAALLADLAPMGPVGGALVGSDRLISSVGAKRALFEATGASAVDMESHAVARVAAASGVPFAVLRAVADPAGRALPGAARAGLGTDGRVRVASVLLSLARRPWEMPGVFALALDTRRALRALRRGAEVAALFGGHAGR